ncbi:PRC-barrel domain-containing protein [Aureimonas altamirensis]|uniref:PRC-barrel domain-containing protein n=1 Tax=Aureimonas altamirensis TaxID=370622 RepID=UPI001E45E668|nr:PRC-barrel domain-containing protein [Aureimonas altamirensis]UHD46957.1 PRC-barrel domain-containing protein [Aureimonas altamirensis]
MKNILIAASIAALMSGSAMAQTTATTPAPASDNPVIVVLPPVTQGAAPAHFLIDDLDDEDVYGVDGAKIGEIEDFVVDTEGQIAAVVIEVGGFLGIGEKEVLVDWSALDIQVTDGDLRVNAPTLTREELEAAADVDVDSMVLGRD